MADVAEAIFRKYRRQELSSLNSQCHAITNKYPEAVSVVQQVHKMLSDIEILANAHLLKWGETERTTVVNSAENRANFCKFLDGKSIFSALYGMYTVTLNKLKAVLKVGAQAGKSGAVKKTSAESTAQDNDFREVKRSKKHISNGTSQTDKNSTNQFQHPQLSSCLQKQC
jgi:hypothetical protein